MFICFCCIWICSCCCSISCCVCSCWWCVCCCRRFAKSCCAFDRFSIRFSLSSVSLSRSLSRFCYMFLQKFREIPSYFSPVFFSFFSLVFFSSVVFPCETFHSATSSNKWCNALSNSVISGDIPVAFSSFRCFALCFSHSKLNLTLADLWDSKWCL